VTPALELQIARTFPKFVTSAASFFVIYQRGIALGDGTPSG
jgi:hypothetical protein